MEATKHGDREKLTIGSLRLAHPFVLAPMAGLTTLAMRRLAREFGASFCYSEMLLAGFITSGKDADDRFPRLYAGDRPVGVQLCGRDVDAMIDAGRWLDGEGFDLVDVNLACPVKKVGKKGYGGYLLREPDHVLRILDGLRRVVRRPLTIKIRAGFDEGDDSYLDLARRAEAVGIDAVAVHGRTVRQQYRGTADWRKIAELKQAVGIPVLGSGDVFEAADAVGMLETTGCDGVLLARGALGSPWIFRDVLSLCRTGRPAEPLTVREKIEVFRCHFRYLCEYTAPDRAYRLIRRIGIFYSKKLGLGSRFRERLCAARSAEAFHRLLDDTLERLP